MGFACRPRLAAVYSAHSVQTLYVTRQPRTTSAITQQLLTSAAAYSIIRKAKLDVTPWLERFVQVNGWDSGCTRQTQAALAKEYCALRGAELNRESDQPSE